MVVVAGMAAVVSAAAMLVLAVATAAVVVMFLVVCVRLRVFPAASHVVRHFPRAVLLVPSAGP